MPIYRSGGLYITAYGFQHLMCWWCLGKQESRPCAHSAYGLLPGFPRHQPAHKVLKTVCGNIWSSTPEDWHNGG